MQRDRCDEDSWGQFEDFEVDTIPVGKIEVSARKGDILMRLPNDILIDGVLTFLTNKYEFINVACVSRTMHGAIYCPRARVLWNTKVFEMCTDAYCPICSLKKRKPKGRSAVNSAMRFLSKAPIEQLKLDCFITDIPAVLVSLSEQHNLSSLSLQLTNKSNSPSLEQLLDTVLLEEGTFCSLKQLVLDSSHLQVCTRLCFCGIISISSDSPTII